MPVTIERGPPLAEVEDLCKAPDALTQRLIRVQATAFPCWGYRDPEGRLIGVAGLVPVAHPAGAGLTAGPNWQLLEAWFDADDVPARLMVSLARAVNWTLESHCYGRPVIVQAFIGCNWPPGERLARLCGLQPVEGPGTPQAFHGAGRGDQRRWIRRM
jgi:hypothetical protein